MRTFKIERIRDVSLTPESFPPPAAGLVETMLQRAWDIIADQDPVEVVLRFVPEVASRVAETIWHPSQRIDTAADGSLVWRATVAGTIEIKLWILSWGGDAEVLEPAELRAEVADVLRRALARYEAAGPGDPTE